MIYVKYKPTGQIAKRGGEIIDGHAVPPLTSEWELPTQQEIDDYLLEKAKETKRQEIIDKRNSFFIEGYEYTGYMGKPGWLSDFSYSKGEEVSNLGEDSTYISLMDNNLDHDPNISPEWWERKKVYFKIDEKGMVDITAECKASLTAPDRYKFYAKAGDTGNRPYIDFENLTHWDVFVKGITEERNRVMKKYNNYQNQVTACATIAQVEAIVVNYAV